VEGKGYKSMIHQPDRQYVPGIIAESGNPVKNGRIPLSGIPLFRMSSGEVAGRSV
jgi:hypothetical protein